jgi:hypothetical protein
VLNDFIDALGNLVIQCLVVIGLQQQQQQQQQNTLVGSQQGRQAVGTYSKKKRAND